MCGCGFRRTPFGADLLNACQRKKHDQSFTPRHRIGMGRKVFHSEGHRIAYVIPFHQNASQRGGTISSGGHVYEKSLWEICSIIIAGPLVSRLTVIEGREPYHIEPHQYAEPSRLTYEISVSTATVTILRPQFGLYISP